MAEETKTYVFGNGDGSGYGTVPAWLAMNNGGFGNGFGGFGGGILGFLLGLFFGNGWGGFGNGFGGFGGNGAGAGFLSNQINNDSGRELLMNAITSQGEASRAATQNLATTLGQDFNLVNTGVQGIKDAVAALAAQTGMSSLQIINSIQSGDASLSRQLCECCCSMQQQVLSQGYESRIQNMQQTETLSAAINGNGRAITDAIADFRREVTKEFCDVKEREMQDKINTQAEIITQLRNQADNAAQTLQFNAAFSTLNNKITELSNKTPNTVPVQWPQLTAVNTSPSVGYGFGYGNGFNPWGYGFGGSSYWG